MFSGRNGNSLAAEVTFTAAYEKIKCHTVAMD